MKLLNIKSGTAITRQYRNIRKTATESGIGIGISGTATIKYFSEKRPIEGSVSIGSLAFLTDIFLDSLSVMKKLRPQYKNIVKRAKNIYNK